MHTRFSSGNLNGRSYLENLGVEGIIIMKRIFNISEDVGWADMLQDRDKWQAVV